MQNAQSILETKKSEIESRLEAVNKDLQKSYTQDFAEQATERENDEVLQSLAATSEQEIALINIALKRLDSGNYGSCSQCGNDIEEKRLNAIPEAEFCMNCAD